MTSRCKVSTGISIRGTQASHPYPRSPKSFTLRNSISLYSRRCLRSHSPGPFCASPAANEGEKLKVRGLCLPVFPAICTHTSTLNRILIGVILLNIRTSCLPTKSPDPPSAFDMTSPQLKRTGKLQHTLLGSGAYGIETLEGFRAIVSSTRLAKARKDLLRLRDPN